MTPSTTTVPIDHEVPNVPDVQIVQHVQAVQAPSLFSPATRGRRKRGLERLERLERFEHKQSDSMSCASPRSVYTIGHSTRTIEAFLALLKTHAIELLADVSRWPASRPFTPFIR